MNEEDPERDRATQVRSSHTTCARPLLSVGSDVPQEDSLSDSRPSLWTMRMVRISSRTSQALTPLPGPLATREDTTSAAPMSQRTCARATHQDRARLEARAMHRRASRVETQQTCAPVATPAVRARALPVMHTAQHSGSSACGVASPENRNLHRRKRTHNRTSHSNDCGFCARRK